MFPRYLQYLLTDFRQTFVTGASRDRDELIAFWGHKVKCHYVKVTAWPNAPENFMFPRYVQYLSMDFCQPFVTGAPRHRDELIRFWGQQVKVQGHGMTECIQDFHVSTISPVSIDRFSLNFCHWCILGHRWPVYVFWVKRSKFKVTIAVEYNFF